jgi:hypothetical protein
MVCAMNRPKWMITDFTGSPFGTWWEQEALVNALD